MYKRQPPTPYESATIASPATAVEPTFDRSLCVETYPGMSLGPEIEAVLARVLEESKRAENSVQFIDEAKREVQRLIEAEAFEACI